MGLTLQICNVTMCCYDVVIRILFGKKSCVATYISFFRKKTFANVYLLKNFTGWLSSLTVYKQICEWKYCDSMSELGFPQLTVCKSIAGSYTHIYTHTFCMIIPFRHFFFFFLVSKSGRQKALWLIEEPANKRNISTNFCWKTIYLMEKAVRVHRLCWEYYYVGFIINSIIWRYANSQMFLSR